MKLLRNTASQIVQMGSLIKTSDGTRLVSSATVRWCKDGTWAAGGGTLSVEETDQYKYAPTQAETDCAVWAVSIDHADAVQPLLLGDRTYDPLEVSWRQEHVDQLEGVFNKLPSKGFLTGTSNSDGDIEMNEATGNFPGSVGSVAGNVSGNVTGTVGSVIGSVGSVVGAVGSVTGDVGGNVVGSVGSVVAAVTVTALSGITNLANWLRAIARKSNNDATALTEINANNGTGTGTYSATTDSQEAIRDRGDAEWGGGGGGGSGGAGGGILHAKIAESSLAPEKFLEIIQGEEKIITFIVEADGRFEESEADEIFVKIKDPTGFSITIVESSDGPIERVTQELDLQVIRVTLAPEETEDLSGGIMRVEIAFDTQKAVLTHSLKIVEQL